MTTSAAQQEDGISGQDSLSAGAIAGVAVGATLGALLLIALGYLFFRRRSNATARPRSTTVGGDITTRSEDSNNASSTPVAASERDFDKPETERPEDMTHPAYAANRLSDHMNLTGIVFEDKEDEPMYVGVPAHLTGQKRWSRQGFDKNSYSS